MRMKAENPLISVIMPSYNSAATVERAVLSVMRQTWENCEVIVVDNSSADATPAVVKKLAAQHLYTDPESGEQHPRVRLIEQPNYGVSSARNAGIRAAQGQYFVSLDADDYYEPETIERLYEALAESKADTVICGMRKVYEDAPEKNEELAPAAEFTGELRAFTDEMFTDLYDLHLISTHSNKIYRTELVREHAIYYNEKLAVNEDIDFVLRYLAVCRRVSVITDVFLNYVQHKTGESLLCPVFLPIFLPPLKPDLQLLTMRPFPMLNNYETHIFHLSVSLSFSFLSSVLEHALRFSPCIHNTCFYENRCSFFLRKLMGFFIRHASKCPEKRIFIPERPTILCICHFTMSPS